LIINYLGGDGGRRQQFSIWGFLQKISVLVALPHGKRYETVLLIKF